jgi:hypothetical protein
MTKIFRLQRPAAALALTLVPALTVLAQDISDSAAQQISAVYQMKQNLTPAQQKESFDLVLAGMTARGQSVGAIPQSALPAWASGPGASVLIDLKATSTETAAQQISAAGGQVLFASAEYGELRANIPADAIDAIAADSNVLWIRSADPGTTNAHGRPPFIARRTNVARQLKRALPGLGASFFIGAVTSQGYVTHTANQALANGIDGTGVRVGVLSDSASPARVASLIATGDLPPDVVVVPGQAGTGADEGTAMMEIVHDLAPGAKLFFATANTGQANFANNIETLRFIYHCDVIVDDFTYFLEGAFQDGTIAKAVNAVVADGALYFSSAANSGNLDSGTSGTWEGDFQNDGDAGSLIDTVEGRPVLIHNFGTVLSPQNFDVLTATSTFISLKWSDPLAGSTNDYDFFVLNSTGTAIKAFSAGSQTGTQDPVEYVFQGINCGTAQASGYCPAVGDRLVVVLWSGTTRALRIDTNRGRLSIGTDGSTFGHNAGQSTISTAATYWVSARKGGKPFTGPDNPIEFFSSDGPRKIFYNPDGSPITPGNVLFSTDGGTTLNKPDITAADGVFTKTPGLLPFFGTSAAASHAAAIAALVKSVNPSLTNGQIYSILTTTTVDDMAPGLDRDSGYGIVMAFPAVQKALAP